MRQAAPLRYAGPRPYDRPHHYVFTVYAVDAVLNLPDRLDQQRLLDAIKDHVIGRGTLTGVFQH
ncbi:MAG TPA: hypothetical protein VJP86_04960 [Vicinamibacterales bacterium]|nr:hypothetical protein [Vicinamibacterales bacterium]